MDLHYKQEVSVGLLVIIAIVLMFTGLTYLSGKSLGASNATFGVRFETILGLNIGDPVQISGVRVGRVADVDLVGVGEVVAYLEVARRYQPRVDARVVVKALDAFGAMYVEYSPGRSEEELAEGQIVPGGRESGLMETAADVAGQASGVLTGVESLLSQRTADELHETLLATQRAMNVVAQLGSGPTITEATRALGQLTAVAGRLDTLLASPGLQRSVERLDEITGNMSETMTNLGIVTEALVRTMEKIEGDSGTLGLLVNDTTMYSEIVRLSESLRLLLDDMRERPQRYFNLRVF